jgi:molecular chaperone GrpE
LKSPGVNPIPFAVPVFLDERVSAVRESVRAGFCIPYPQIKWRAVVAEDQNESEVTQQAQSSGAEADVQDAGPYDVVDGGEHLQAEIEKLQSELVEIKEQSLRVAAEAQNQRRRAERDVENAHKYALEKFAAALLPVADNLERSLEAADKTNEALKPVLDGVDLTHKGLIDILTKFQVVQVNPVGEPFDPQVHQAMTLLDNPNVEPNTVLHVMQKGYTLNGRLLRPAMVVVSKGAPQDAPKKIDESA